MSHKGQYPPWRRRLDAKLEETQRKFRPLLEVEKGKITKVPRKSRNLS